MARPHPAPCCLLRGIALAFTLLGLMPSPVSTQQPQQPALMLADVAVLGATPAGIAAAVAAARLGRQVRFLSALSFP